MTSSPSVKTLPIGRSYFGQPLELTTLGAGPGVLLFCGPFSGDRFSSDLLALFFSALHASAASGRRFFRTDLSLLLSLRRLSFLMNPNPDAPLIRASLPHDSSPIFSRPRALLGAAPPSSWRANGRGVDPSLNFSFRFSRTSTSPSPGGFGGDYPESEPESVSFVSCARSVPLRLALFFEQGDGISFPDLSPSSFPGGDVLFSAALRLSPLPCRVVQMPGSPEGWLSFALSVPAMRVGASSFSTPERAFEALTPFLGAMLTV